MTARAMWKGVLTFGDQRVPVKLYAAVQDRDVHFRLLHAADGAPVRQALIDPDTGQQVPYAEARRAYVTEDRELVVLNEQELEAVEPEPSREIRIVQFVPPEQIDHRWYRRPYYLGPDENATDGYRALVAALAETRREGVARWVMRKKEYVGALRLHRGYPMLMALRHAGEVVSAQELEAPSGRPPDPRELDMARKLVEMLAAHFDPTEYHDEYRHRVEQLIATKARGGALPAKRAPRKRAAEDLTQALKASLEQERKRA